MEEYLPLLIVCASSPHTLKAKQLYTPKPYQLQGMSNADFLRAVLIQITCENLRIAIFILTDCNNNTYGLQLELLGETATSAPLTLLTLVGEGKLEYYGEIITSTPSPSPNSQISTAIDDIVVT